jgi:hypothetical protein
MIVLDEFLEMSKVRATAAAAAAAAVVTSAFCWCCRYC